MGKVELRPAAPTTDEIARLVHLYNAGRHAELENQSRLLIERYPESGFAWKALGAALRMQGKNALPALQKAADLLPDDAACHNDLGAVLEGRGQFEDAATCYRRALKLKPDFAIVYRNLGNTLIKLGQLDDAVASFRRAVNFQPDFAEAHSNLGNALHELGQFGSAAASCRRALELQPDFAIAHYNLGNALLGLGQLDGAVASYRRAVELKPDFAEAYSNLGYTLQEFGQLDTAASCCRRAVELKPDFAEAYSNLGNTLKALGQLDGAVASYRRAVELKPDFAIAHNNLGLALHALGRPDAALVSYQRALEIKPDYADAYGNMLYMHAFARDIPPESECSLAENWETIALSESERIAARDRPFDYPPSAGRRLKIGVVSAELGQHPVAEFLEPILEHLDRSRFHISLFPTSIRKEARAARFEELADEYTSLVGISDEEAADLIRSKRIDVLIDTTSHMRNGRLGIFARRAAPVQCHYIGYHGTTGLTEMDWFIADVELLPPGYDIHFREKIWRLPRLRLAYKGNSSLPESRWTPSPDGTIWLGSFNNLTKVREDALELWAKVMNAIPKSRLLLKDRLAQDPAVQERIRVELGRHGISADRFEFAAPIPEWTAHMCLYDRLDIALDTIPLNSETTAFDALWMGVPLVALQGNWVGGRMASTILKALGKTEWIAHSDDEYVAIVVALAKDVEGRKLLRATQRKMVSDSPLCDASGLTKALEEAFGAMFDRSATFGEPA